MFWQVEGQTGLYVLFKTVCDAYELLPAENYKLPPEAEGLEPTAEPKSQTLSIMKSASPPKNSLGVEEDLVGVGRTNTRRHIRQSPSVGSAVHTVLESDEEEADVASRLQSMQIAEEDGETEVPVIVETYEVEENQENQENQDPEELASAPTDERGIIHVQDDSSTASWDRMSETTVGEKSELSKDEDIATQPQTESEEGSHPILEPEIEPETEADLEELERFSPEIKKEEPMPVTADIPDIEIAVAGDDKKESEEL